MDKTVADGILVASYDQDAFGNILSGSSSGFHLTTKRLYPTIGLYYFYHRWYDPQLGRFIERDVFKYVNRYCYCENNPILYVDPKGLYYKPPFDVCAESVSGQCCCNMITGKCSGDGCYMPPGKGEPPHTPGGHVHIIPPFPGSEFVEGAEVLGNIMELKKAFEEHYEGPLPPGVEPPPWCRKEE
ncbi:RHS repeat-associated core domain-containing protein [Candidatus Sumerlaeota bacterium]|nr:RHS repeat-associated core domain-containing protein [Candidatus Sumerlaeota bacterium]